MREWKSHEVSYRSLARTSCASSTGGTQEIRITRGEIERTACPITAGRSFEEAHNNELLSTPEWRKSI